MARKKLTQKELQALSKEQAKTIKKTGNVPPSAPLSAKGRASIKRKAAAKKRQAKELQEIRRRQNEEVNKFKRKNFA